MENALKADNAFGNTYYNNNYITPGFMKYIYKNATFCVEQMKSQKKISPKLATIINTDFQYGIYENVINRLATRLYYNKKIKTSPSDSTAIVDCIESVYKKLPPSNKNIIKFYFSSSYTSKYYRFLFNKMNEKEKLFQHKKDLNALLCKYPNLVPSYISIDEDQFDKSWRNNIESFNLTRYHLRASKALIAYIKDAIYKDQSVSILRYILLDAKGNIINDNLPRPSTPDNLKQALDKIVL